MKILTLTFSLILSFALFGQSRVAGHYRNYYFHDIQLHADSTFEYNWYNERHGSWTKGTWTLKGDTVYFHIIPMFDTLSITKNNGNTADTLILSKYSTPRRVAPQQLAGITSNSVKQSRASLPDTMVFKRNRLYEIKNGILVTKKRIEIIGGLTSDPWYNKIYD